MFDVVFFFVAVACWLAAATGGVMFFISVHRTYADICRREGRASSIAWLFDPRLQIRLFYSGPGDAERAGVGPQRARATQLIAAGFGAFALMALIRAMID